MRYEIENSESDVQDNPCYRATVESRATQGSSCSRQSRAKKSNRHTVHSRRKLKGLPMAEVLQEHNSEARANCSTEGLSPRPPCSSGSSPVLHNIRQGEDMYEPNAQYTCCDLPRNNTSHNPRLASMDTHHSLPSVESYVTWNRFSSEMPQEDAVREQADHANHAVRSRSPLQELRREEEVQRERELGAHLRRIGDEIYTLYLQRQQERERHHWRAVWVGLYNFISDTLAAFYIPRWR
ncbi:bcl-2-binding component 3 [Protopterus annectens]|uniref:bcl-2-binding component 3 n=1 Tax=Protopterus annectens TaxID=7888 RepID=UPI001CFA94A8|nr:bcl-2-binding component 3 [Protopterus annectens]